MIDVTEFACGSDDQQIICSLARADDVVLPADPALLLTFSSTRQSALTEHPYDIPAQAFLAAGHYVLSFDLPNHGERVDQHGEGIDGMCKAFIAGHDPFTRFVTDGIAALDTCVQRGIGTNARICASGVSRAGYCAMRLAAADPRITAVAALAPVTDWRALSEWTAVSHRPEVAVLALEQWVTQLSRKTILLYIGNQDERVSTAACVRLGLRLFEIEATSERPSSTELHVVEAVGHGLSNEWRMAGAHSLLRVVS